MMWQPLAALALAAGPVTAPAADVQEIRVVPAGGDTEIVVYADPSVEAREFQLNDP